MKQRFMSRNSFWNLIHDVNSRWASEIGGKRGIGVPKSAQVDGLTSDKSHRLTRNLLKGLQVKRKGGRCIVRKVNKNIDAFFYTISTIKTCLNIKTKSLWFLNGVNRL